MFTTRNPKEDWNWKNSFYIPICFVVCCCCCRRVRGKFLHFIIIFVFVASLRELFFSFPRSNGRMREKNNTRLESRHSLIRICFICFVFRSFKYNLLVEFYDRSHKKKSLLHLMKFPVNYAHHSAIVRFFYASRRLEIFFHSFKFVPSTCAIVYHHQFASFKITIPIFPTT